MSVYHFWTNTLRERRGIHTPNIPVQVIGCIFIMCVMTGWYSCSVLLETKLLLTDVPRSHARTGSLLMLMKQHCTYTPSLCRSLAHFFEDLLFMSSVFLCWPLISRVCLTCCRLKCFVTCPNSSPWAKATFV